MQPASAPTIYAIDFGTSNSLLAAAAPERTWGPIPLDPRAPDPTVFRSLLHYSPDSNWSFGATALEQYVQSGLSGRFIRSVKRFLPMASFTHTRIGSRNVRLEELVGIFLREMRTRANAHFDSDVRRVVLGRPARFSDQDSFDELAQERLAEAARFAGFEEVAFCPEPVAAAVDSRGVGEDSLTVLVADLGGGTSDFTVARLRDGELDEVLAMGGVSLAGDVLDGSVMRGSVARHFGAEINYRVPFGSNTLTMPRPLVDKLCSPAELCLLRRRDIMEFLRDLRSWSLGGDDKACMDRLLCLVEDALGFQLFENIEQTKRALSDSVEAAFRFAYADIDITETLRRSDFEVWIKPTVDRIFGCLEGTLARAGLAPPDVDCVCLTGGTARVPLIARGLSTRFGGARLRHLSGFHSVIQGLAERARQAA